METIIVTAFNTLNGSSGFLSFLVSVSTLAFGAWLYFRKTNIEEITSIGTLQQKQITSLLEQIQFLAEELSKARNQIAEIHEQNVHLMQQVRESNHRIQELERLLDINRSI
jgi:septal ring factor EnvC (AmiA/AmiB activator)